MKIFCLTKNKKSLTNDKHRVLDVNFWIALRNDNKLFFFNFTFVLFYNGLLNF